MSSKCCCSNELSLSYYLSCLKTTMMKMMNRCWNLNYCFPHSIGIRWLGKRWCPRGNGRRSAGLSEVHSHNVVDRDLDSDRCPDSVGISQFASHAPALGLETRDRFAEQRLLRRVDDPGAITIVGDTEILITFVVGNRTSNPLGARISSDDANALTIRLSNWPMVPESSS